MVAERGTSHGVEKLRGADNWGLWKHAVRNILRATEGVYEICIGELKKPDALVGDNIQNDQQAAYNASFKEWDKTDRIACEKLTRMIESNIADSGATDHLARNKNCFTTLDYFEIPIKIHIEDKSTMDAVGRGNIDFEAFVDGKWSSCVIKNILYVPKARRNLFSVTSALDKELEFKSTSTSYDKAFFEACVEGKQKKISYISRIQRSKESGAVINADLCGPMEAPSFAQKISDMIALVNNHYGLKVRTFQCDGGREFDNHEVKNVVSTNGIKFVITIRYSPEQNGSAERSNQTIDILARTILLSKNLPKFLWAEAANTAVYVLNRTGSSGEASKTPFELFTGKVRVHVDFVPEQTGKAWGCFPVKDQQDDSQQLQALQAPDNSAMKAQGQTEDVREDKLKLHDFYDESIVMKAFIILFLMIPITNESVGNKSLQEENQSEMFEKRKLRDKKYIKAPSYQQKGIGYDETFSPLVRFDTIRALLSVAANVKLELQQLDVKTAILNGVLDEEIFM
ncbi:uncharacterized protein LOC131674682 [Phymastichus coffea]|uniref:uncharacterized protein LOC131674682 n=1 Tax=Phymastichus coffea TaxID=108790 RepID=UPI00273BB442|nr:uncharacterized protein LOC131674682 [Phymastichus coffea]